MRVHLRAFRLTSEVLGPQRRTRELLAEVERLLDLPADSDRVDHWLEMAQLHTPMGLDVGAETPATIALSILAEIQQTLNATTALPLRQVRAKGFRGSILAAFAARCARALLGILQPSRMRCPAGP